MKTTLSLRRYLAPIASLLLLPLSSSLAQTNCVASPAGLVSWWRAEGNAADATGANPGTLMGGLTFSTGEVGQAFNFDGVDGQILVPNAPSLNFGAHQDFSVEAWIQPQVSATTFDLMTIVDKRNAPDISHGMGYEMALTGGRLECRISDSMLDVGTSFGAAGPDLRDGSFHHVAVTFIRNATNGGHYYVDGVAVLTFDPTVEPGDLANDQPLRIGSHPTPSVFAQFKGKIDEVSIYQRALSAADIQAVYTAGAMGKCAASTVPYFVAQPESQTVAAGTDATFSVTAGGSAPLSYQWSFNGTNLAGATGNSLTKTNVQLGDAGNYAVVVSNSGGTVTSSNAVLTVNAVPPATLWNVDFAAFGRVKVGFAAAGQGNADFWNDYTFPWQAVAGLSSLKRADGVSTTVGLTLQNGAGQTIVPHPDLMYQVACYSQDLGDMTLTITNLPTGEYAFYLYGHAGADTANTVFELLVGGNDFGNQPTATNPSWSLTNWVAGAQYVVYRGVTVTNGGAPVVVKCHPGESGYTYLNGMQIMAVVATPPVIVSQPASRSVLAGADVTFEVTAGGSAPLSYQWSFNGTNLAGATGNSLTKTNVQLGDAGNYAVVVSNNGGMVLSSNAVLTVNAVPPATLLNVNFAAYNQVKTGFAATGQTGSDFWNSLTFPFQASAGLGGVKLADGTVTTAGLTVENGGGHTAFSHPDLMYDTCCYAQDYGVITLTVTNLPAGGYDIYLYGHAGDTTANTVFQLLVGGNDFGNQSTATNPSWSLTNWVEGAQYVVYRGVTVTNGGAPVVVKCHPGVSGYTYLNGLQIMAAGSTPPVIVSQPASQTVLAGADATLSVTASGSPPLSYQWRFNGTNLTGATERVLALNHVAVSAAGFYSVRVTNTMGGAISSDAALTVVRYASNALFNVNFGGHLTPEGLNLNKVGLAAVGKTTNDLWNFYSRDIAPGQYRENGALANLQQADGGATAVGLLVNNAPGAWFNGSSDVMYHGYLYPLSGNVILTLTNLPTGQYDVYLYSGQGNCQMSVGTTDYGVRTTYDGVVANPTVWTEGVQYARFGDVQVLAGQAVTMVVVPGAGGTAAIAGLQIAGVTTNTVPYFVAQPESQTVAAGTDATFSVTAGGSAPLSYQWSFNGTNLAGATGNSLTKTNVQLGDAGNYAVVVSNSGGTVTSSNAVLTVNAVPPATLWNVDFAAFGRVKVGFAAAGQGNADFWNDYTFPWQAVAGLSSLKRADGVSTTVGLTLQNGAGQTIVPHPDLMYQVACYSQDLGDMTLTITNLPTGEYAFYLYGHAGADTANTVFELLVGGNDFGNQPTATNPSWSLTNWVAGAQYVVYRGVTVTNGGAPVVVKCHPGESGYTYLNGMQIMAVVATPPVIVSQPASRSVLAGADVTFEVTAGGSAPLSYQWSFNGTNLAGATGNSLTKTNVQLGDAGNYAVVVSNNGGMVLSSNAVLTVNAVPPATLLNVNFAAYNQVKTGFAATGQTGSDFWNSLTFPFQASAGLGGVKLADGTVTTAGLTVENGGGHTAFSHPDLMYDTCCYAQDYGVITLTVTNLPAGGYDIYLYGHAGDTTANTVFQLLVGGNDFGNQSTATNPSWSLTNWVEGAQYVVYRGVTVTNGGAPVVVKCHPGVSGYTYLNGLQIMAAGSTPPVIVSQPASQTVLAGADATLSVTASGSPPLSYQWRFNGTNLTGATGSLLTKTKVQLGDAGNYAVVVSNSLGTVTSSNAVLTVNPALSCVPSAAGLVSWWRAENNAFDSVGTNTGVLQNGIGFAGGEAGLGFSLDGVNDHVRIPDADKLHFTSAMTVETWIKPTSVIGTIREVAAKWDIIPGYNQRSYALVILADGRIYFTVSGNGMDSEVGTAGSTNLVVANQWSHIAGTYDGAKLRIYLNGVLENEQAYTAGIFPEPANLAIGGAVGGATPGNVISPFAGLIDEFALYNRALSVDQIQAIYNAGSAGKCVLPPVITADPTNLLVLAGSNVVLFANASSGMPLNYQWTLNGANLAGATNTSLNLTNAGRLDAGFYRLVASNSTGAVTSAPAFLDVRYSFTYGNDIFLAGTHYTFVDSVHLQLLSAFPNGTLFYSLDGSSPSFLSSYYSSPFNLNHTALLRVIAYSADFLQAVESPAILLTVVPSYPLTLTSPGGGTVLATSPSSRYASNTVVTLMAQPAVGWTFLEWRGDGMGSSPTLNLTMDRAKTVQAIFGTTLGTTVAGSGSVSVQPTLPLYPYGMVVRLTGIPQLGNYFAFWGNAASGNTNPLAFTVTSPAPTVSSLFATLGVNQNALSVITDGLGKVTVSPLANVYATGASVSLNAIPDPGQQFLGWGGDATGSVNPLPISLNASKNITATFTRRPSLVVSPPLGGLFEDGFRLTLQGEFGQAYRIETSTNLLDWLPLNTITNFYGTTQIQDESATNTGRSFYRSVVAP